MRKSAMPTAGATAESRKNIQERTVSVSLIITISNTVLDKAVKRLPFQNVKMEYSRL